MDQKPLHFDGSMHATSNAENTGESSEPFVLTDEVRKYIGANPYDLTENE